MKAEKALMNSILFKKNWGTNCTDMFKIELAFKFREMELQVWLKMTRQFVCIGVPTQSITKEICSTKLIL